LAYTYQQIGPIGLLKLSGELDARAASDIRDNALAAPQADGSHLAVEMTGVNFADSTGIGFVVALKKQQAKHGKRVVLVGLNGQPLDIVKLTRIDRSIDTFDNMDSFVASLTDDERQAVAGALPTAD